MSKKIKLSEKTTIENLNQANIRLKGYFKGISLFLVIVSAMVFAVAPTIAEAAFQDTGWLNASTFQGSVGSTCGVHVGSISGQSGESFRIENSINFPAGNYSISIEAVYGYYEGDPQAPQTNEVMRLRTNVDSKDVPDLNGAGGGRHSRDDCTELAAQLRTYSNIAGSTIRYNGQGSIIFEGRNNSQSITVTKVRIYGESDVGNQVQLPTVSLSANPMNVPFNGNSTLTWFSNNATSCSASGGVNGWSGAKSFSGNFNTGSLTNTTTYNITCTNSAGSANDSVTVSVGNQVQLPTVSLSANPMNVPFNGNSTLTWFSNNATSCSASGGGNCWRGGKKFSGNFNTGNFANNTTYNSTCTNSAGSANDSVTVSVGSQIYPTPYQTPYQTPYPTPLIYQYPTPYQTPYPTPYPTPFIYQYPTPYQTPYPTPYQTPYPTPYQTPYPTPYNSYQYPTPYNSYQYPTPYQTPYPTPYNSYQYPTPFIYQYPTPYPTPFQVQINNQPTVVLSADQANISFNETTSIRWYTTNAASCSASGGSVGWAGAKSIGPGSFYTGSLTASRTYVITCSNSVGSANDSVTVTVQPQVISTVTTITPRPVLTSLVLITSSVDRNQPIVPTIDNTRPHPGDEINYTVSYQNIGTGAITGLTLRIDLPLEVDYMLSNPNNPTRSGNTLIFNLGTLKANGQGTVSARVRVRNNIAAGVNLNFPATLSYVDPSGVSQSVSANVSAQVWSEPVVPLNVDESASLGASAIEYGTFLPVNIFGWLLLLILILILILLVKYFFNQSSRQETATLKQ